MVAFAFFKARPLIVGVWALVVLIFGALAALLWPREAANNNDYTTARVEKTTLQQLVTATGTVQPINYVDVGVQVSGQLKKIHVIIGQEVHAGDLLAEMDTTVYQAKVEGLRAQRQVLVAQQADKTAQLQLAQQRLNRTQGLNNANATTQDALQNAQALLASAKAQLDMVAAQRQQLEFNLKVDEANLAYARIYAPISGTVVSMPLRQGQTLNANQQSPTLLRIADLSTITLQAQVSEADVSQLRPNMPVYFTTLGNKGQRWQGQLRTLLPTPEVNNAVVLYNALFDVPNPQRQLLLNMSAQVFFIAEEAPNALVIPLSALKAVSTSDEPRATDRKPNSHPPQVQVLTPSGKVETRSIRTGLNNRVQIQVLEGLSEGETVITGLRTNAPQNANPKRGLSDVSGAARMMR